MVENEVVRGIMLKKKVMALGFNFFKWLRSEAALNNDIVCRELLESAQELQIRNLCFWTCVNMVANAIGRCEVKTYKSNKEVFDKEYYLFNYEPNVNQNSTEFWHKLIARLYSKNEVLVISVKRRDGDSLVVADGWQRTSDYPARQNEYSDVVVGSEHYNKIFKESDVLHLKLNNKNIKPIIDGIYQSYYRLILAATRAYEWDNGQHWKVHVSQLAQGEDNWAKNFKNMIDVQMKPFFDSNGAVLPEFDGYQYDKITSDTTRDTRDIKSLVEDIFDFTARAIQIPAVLVNGQIEGTEDANTRFLTNCIDPICDQLQEEITRKRYGFERWKNGDFIRVDSSSIIHFDLFANAANVEKLVGSGAYTINDVRRAANQSKINEPWADEHFMTRNIADMGEAARQLGAEEGGINRG